VLPVMLVQRIFQRLYNTSTLDFDIAASKYSKETLAIIAIT
jgi:hypothetical protein